MMSGLPVAGELAAFISILGPIGNASAQAQPLCPAPPCPNNFQAAQSGGVSLTGTIQS